MSKVLAVLLLVANLGLALLIWQDARYQPAAIAPGGDLRLIQELQPPDAQPATSEPNEIGTGHNISSNTDQAMSPAASPLAPHPKHAQGEATATAKSSDDPKPAKAAKPTKTAEAQPKTKLHCYRYGPVASRLTAIGIMARLKAESRKQKVEETKGTPAQFWVHFSSAKDKLDASNLNLNTAGAQLIQAPQCP
jgi:hypothetical protein